VPDDDGSAAFQPSNTALEQVALAIEALAESGFHPTRPIIASCVRVPRQGEDIGVIVDT
jgi:hypothetical protein